MKNLDLTITGPQGSGKTTAAYAIVNMLGVTNPRVFLYNKPLYLKYPLDLAEELREEAPDVVVFDAGFTDERELSIAAAAVKIYREITNRNVAAVYCAQFSLSEILNPL